MDFSTRGDRPSQPAAAPTNRSSAGSSKKDKSTVNKVLRWVTVALVAAIAILVIAVSASIVVAKPANDQKYVDKTKLQAVFMNGGQVYFGNITSLNGKTLVMGNIYYLRVNQQVQPNGQNSGNDVSLVKLGCELHGPQDQMIVNRDQVVFWENLKDDGQVAKAVKQYRQQNPNGQKCEDQAAQNSNSSNTTNTTTNKKQ